METIQLTIEESLLAEMNRATNALRMTPSDFMTVALERALARREIIALERRDAQVIWSNHSDRKKSRNGRVNKSWESHETRRRLLAHVPCS